MNISLTQKERMLLEDQKSHEELCIQKYTNYANQVQDPQLKQMLLNFAAQEQSHLDSINQLLQGKVPNVGQGQQQQGQQNSQQQGMQQGGQQSQQQQGGQQDMQQGNMQHNTLLKQLLQDLLMTEKYVSGTYNVAIFEFTSPEARNVLNHIQKEEQQHGEGIFNYMSSHGMYQTQ